MPYIITTRHMTPKTAEHPSTGPLLSDPPQAATCRREASGRSSGRWSVAGWSAVRWCRSRRRSGGTRLYGWEITDKGWSALDPAHNFTLATNQEER